MDVSTVGKKSLDKELKGNSMASSARVVCMNITMEMITFL